MNKQLLLDSKKFKKHRSEHGGAYKNPQKRKRPLSLRSQTHFVLRSTKAVKEWNFRRHKRKIDSILKRFAKTHHIGLVSYANVGNHLHLCLEIPSRGQYRKFVRAISASIMIAVTGYSRWNRAPKGFQFWDARPFSRIIGSWREVLALDKYMLKNQLEGKGLPTAIAKAIAKSGWAVKADYG